MPKQILIISTEFGTEQDELVKPLEGLRERGHEVTLATPNGGAVQTMVGDKDLGDTVEADAKLADLNGEFDAIVLPGGTLNADAGRMDSTIRELVAAQAAAGKTVAAICHAPWILINAGLAAGKTLTSYESVELDLRNAGAIWKDEPVVECDANGYHLITSRNPGDLDEFIAAIDRA